MHSFLNGILVTFNRLIMTEKGKLATFSVMDRPPQSKNGQTNLHSISERECTLRKGGCDVSGVAKLLWILQRHPKVFYAFDVNMD